eukprot:COSAG06_NODE_3157_length_5758_cov_9.311362_5_plen_61_part_00
MQPMYGGGGASGMMGGIGGVGMMMPAGMGMGGMGMGMGMGGVQAASPFANAAMGAARMGF